MKPSFKVPAKKYFDLSFFLVLLGICLARAWFRNFGDLKIKGPPEIYSDKADYYVYLPATFIYNWEVTKFPKGIDIATIGFTLDYKHRKIVVKTTCGEAILVCPFFLASHAFHPRFADTGSGKI